MTWEEYYDRFYDWAESTKLKHLAGLTDFGPSGQVADCATEFSPGKNSDRFLKKALAHGVRFTAEEAGEMLDLLGAVPEQVLLTARTPFTGEQLRDFIEYYDLDRALLCALAEKSGIPAPNEDGLADENHISWEEYYEGFSDWDDGKLLRYIPALTSFGPSEEVAEIAVGFMEQDNAFAFTEKALEKGVRFTAAEAMEIVETYGEIPEKVLLTARTSFSEEQLRALLDDYIAEEKLVKKLARKSGIRFRTEEDAPPEPVPEPEPAPPKKSSGLFGFLAGYLAADAILGREKQPHRGRCNGDCAHCPPHYGYRYGRWYYGHHHNYGCEFGGNRGL